MVKQTLIVMFGIGLTMSSCKKQGCTDSNAQNYSEKAKKDDGSCAYSNTTIYTETFTINDYDWSGDGNGYEVALNAPFLNDHIANNGAVMLYIKEGGYFWALPYSMNYGTWTSHYTYLYKVGEIRLYAVDDDGNTYNPATNEYKVVAISQSMLLEHPDVNLTDYEEVKKTFKL